MFSLVSKFRKRRMNNKGFTLIELIVVIAILGIIALIAIPRFAGIQQQARIDSDTQTARQIINTARIIEANYDLNAGGGTVGFPSSQPGLWSVTATSSSVTIDYMQVPSPRTGGDFTLTSLATGSTVTYRVTTDGDPALTINEGQE